MLRILNRAGAATASQLAVLAYGHRRVAQARLLALWRPGLLERAALPPTGLHGGSPYAYRLSRHCLVRLGYRRASQGNAAYLGHTLDTIEAVCSLVGMSRPPDRPIVQAWLTESMARSLLGSGPAPDAVVVVNADSGSAVLCLELDEATQHRAPIREKLRAYERALAARSGWLALFVVPSDARSAWLRRTAVGVNLGERPVAWTVTTEDLAQWGVDAIAIAIGGAERQPLRTLFARERVRWSPVPIASVAWLELLGTGGGESFADLLA